MRRIHVLTLLFIALISVCASVASATVFQYEAYLDGPSEFPANASPGTGYATVDYDNVAKTLNIAVNFSGLTGTTTASHIHSPTTAPFFQNASVATTTPSFSGFPTGVTSGSYSNLLDLTLASSWNPSYITLNGGTPAGAEAAFATQLAGGFAYWNIHTSTFGGGEIRGFLVAIPEPASFTLLALGMASIGCVTRRRR
jgi:hypothetical protein